MDVHASNVAHKEPSCQKRPETDYFLMFERSRKASHGGKCVSSSDLVSVARRIGPILLCLITAPFDTSPELCSPPQLNLVGLTQLAAVLVV